MSSTELELIPSVLSAASGNISRTLSAPSLLLTTSLDPPRTVKDNDGDEPFQDVELATSLDGMDAEGVDAWHKLDSICILGLDDGNAARHYAADMIPVLTVSKLATYRQIRLGSRFTSG